MTDEQYEAVGKHPVVRQAADLAVEKLREGIYNPDVLAVLPHIIELAVRELFNAGLLTGSVWGFFCDACSFRWITDTKDEKGWRLCPNCKSDETRNMRFDPK